MGLPWPQKALIFAYVAVTLSPSDGQTIDACDDPQCDTANATGSVRFAGFPPPSTIEDNIWTLFTAVKEVQDIPANLSHIEQTFCLNTIPSSRPILQICHTGAA